MIEKLVDSGHAHAAEDGSVYFRTDSFSDYGKLSRLKEREISTSNNDREQSDEYQRDSAADLIFPHLENEIASKQNLASLP